MRPRTPVPAVLASKVFHPELTAYVTSSGDYFVR
jgi:hypothetical protein